MAKAFLRVRMIGNGVLPETVKASDLAEFLIDAEKAIQETSAAHGIELPDTALVSLVAVQEGSNELTLAIDPLVGEGTGEVSEAIAEGRYEQLPTPAWQSLAKIWKLAAKRNWDIELLPNPEINVRSAVISPNRAVPEPPGPPTVAGTTTLYGRCLRVGGFDATAHIVLEDGFTRLIVAVDLEMAKRLAHQLYEDVGIEGQATWRTDTWEIVSFKSNRILDYHPSGLVQGFEELSRAAEGRWENIDADEYVRRLRSPAEQQ